MSSRKSRRALLRELGAAAALGGAAAAASAAEISEKRVEDLDGLPSRIAFGSCGHQDKPQPVLRTVVGRSPDLFIYLGDNIYGDSRDLRELEAKYARLAAKPEFQALRGSVPVLSTWDDHDYGENDAGKEYPLKEESRRLFLDFWQVPEDSPRRRHPGIYGEHTFTSGGRTLQVLLLDARSFRDPLQRAPTRPPFKNDYTPDPDPGKTILGAEQWRWLEACFRRPADLRIVCSSIQFSHEYNGWESWTNLPAEQRRMLDLIATTRANGVVFISGDVHWGELSRRPVPGLYPLYDVTSSGITETWPTIEANCYRVGEAVRDNNFGLIEIDWRKREPEAALQILDRHGRARVSHTVRLSTLRPPDR
jgi:alkaline phosphatase D